MPDEWRRSTLKLYIRIKEIVQNCTNYRGIKLMSHATKLWERIIEHKLRYDKQIHQSTNLVLSQKHQQ